MRELHFDISEGDGPIYLRIAEGLRRAMEDQRLQPNDLLPSTRTLAHRFQVHRHTVMNALAELVAEGWLESEPGRGYRVVEGIPRYYGPSTDGVPPDAEPSSPPRFAFPSGQPDLRVFPMAEYSATLREVLRSTDPSRLLGYDNPAGAQELIGQLCSYLRRLRDVTSREIVVTHGSQEGIFLVAKHLLKPGQVVAVEARGYAPAWQALRLAGGTLRGLPVDGCGLVPSALEQLARKESVALLYVTPLHQYPTTVTMPVERRRELYDVAVRHGIPILEDDYDHEFHYRSRPLAPLKSRDPEQLVYYTSTFSKVVYPSARLGFVVLPEGQGAMLADLKRITTRQSNTLLQLTQARWMENGGFERHLRRMRRLYQGRLNTMVRVLTEQSLVHDVSLTFQAPDGGMSLWVDFGCDTSNLALAAEKVGVSIRSGSEYDLEGGTSTHLRLGFASSTNEEIEEGLALLLREARSL